MSFWKEERKSRRGYPAARVERLLDALPSAPAAPKPISPQRDDFMKETTSVILRCLLIGLAALVVFVGIAAVVVVLIVQALT